MPKLTDPSYTLPNIMALGSTGMMDTGTTEPMAVFGVNMDTGQRGKYIVKFRNSNRMSPQSSCRELLGAWMAWELNIHCIEPALINITDEFVKTISDALDINLLCQASATILALYIRKVTS